MFRKPQNPLEDCIEILRRINNSNGTEKSELLARFHRKTNMRDVENLVALCELICYHYDKMKQKEE